MVLLRELFYPTKQKKAHFKLRPIYATISIASENNNNNDKRWSFVIVTLCQMLYTYHLIGFIYSFSRYLVITIMH